MKVELEFSKNDSFVLVISFIKLATFIQGVPMRGETIQHYCTTLKYLFRATAVLQMKSIEKDLQFKNMSVKERVALQMEVLPLIPRDAVVSVTHPFGRLNAFAADVVKMSGVVKRPLIEDCTMNLSDPGAAIISQQQVSLSILYDCVVNLLNDCNDLMDQLLLGFKYTEKVLHIFDNPAIFLSDTGAIFSSIADWVTLKLHHEYKLDPYHCKRCSLEYFLDDNEPTRKIRISSYIQLCDTITDILVTLVHLTSGPCARATEMTSTLYRNSPERERSLIFSNGHMCIVYTYNKTNSLCGSVKTIVRPIAKPVAKILLLFSVLVRPFKERLLGIEKSGAAWNYLWTKGTKQITPDQVRNAIQFYCSKYGFPLSIRLSRQYISWLCVKYLNYIDVELDIYSGFGHSKTTSLNHYAHTSTESANIDRDSWNAMIKTAVSYQKLLFGINLEPTIKSQTQIVSTRHFRNNDLNSNSPSLSINAPEMTFFENYNVKEDFQMGIYLKKGLKDYMQFGVDKIGIFIDNLN
jgi:hypothetical protein